MLPNFLVIGAQKAGTTWLAQKISSHPAVYSPRIKEIHFFNKRKNYQKGIEFYESYFKEVDPLKHKAVGEFTPNYLWTSESESDLIQSERNKDIPGLIKKHLPNVKLIVTLRNPVERAISAYYHHIAERRIPPEAKILDVLHEYGIESMGHYANHLEKWLNYFDKNQILILIFELDILQNSLHTIQSIYQFIGVDSNFIPPNLNEKSNIRKGSLYLRINYKSKNLGAIIRKLRIKRLLSYNYKPILISDRDKKVLSEIYVKSNKDLEKLIKRKLPW